MVTRNYRHADTPVTEKIHLWGRPAHDRHRFAAGDGTDILLTMAASMFWYDFETTGTDPIMDRPIQFAGVRTDLDLNVLDAPVNLLGCPGDDVIPTPEAILVTGLSMLEVRESGLNETSFCGQVLKQFSVPETCVCGYNSIRFDDEFTRQMFYRNFRDPYAREWQHGNSRWDVIDLFRMAFALRPDGIQWPTGEGGVPSFRLEALTAANDVEHSDAHDAVADVMATVALTRKLRDKQPKLYEFLFSLRQKKEVLKQLYPIGKTPVVHVSSMYGARRACIAVVLPICSHPTNSNGIICFDLSEPTGPLVAASASDVERRVFTAVGDLGEGESRIPLITIHVNRCPAIAPMPTLDADGAVRLGIDLKLCQERMRELQSASGLVEKISEAFQLREFPRATDPDLMLYQGGFFSRNDSEMMAGLHEVDANDLSGFTGRFDDDRLDEMLFRFRARNYPGTLSGEEGQRWDMFRRERWHNGNDISEALKAIDEQPAIKSKETALVDLRNYLVDVSRAVIKSG